MARHRRFAAVALGIPLSLAALLSAHSAHPAVQSPSSVPVSDQTATVHVVVLDSHGQPVVDLRPAAFSVTVDGRPRNVVAADYVFRGPGASEAAVQSAAARAEARRRFVVAIDEGSLLGGDERAVRALASRLIDRLGPADEVAVVTFPGGGTEVALGADRETAFGNLRKVAGRAVGVAAAPLPSLPVGSATDGAAGTNRAGDRSARPAPETPDLRAPSDGASASIGNTFPAGAAEPLAMLGSLLDRLSVTPDPKTVVLISAGLPDLPRSRAIDQAASSAAAAQATIQVLYRRIGGWQRTVTSSDPQTDPAAARAPGARLAPARGGNEQVSGLAALAALTGGSLVEVGKDVDQAVGRLLSGLGGDYTVTIESGPADWDGKTHDLRVTVRDPRASVTRAKSRWQPATEPVAAEGQPAAPAAAVPSRVPVTPPEPASVTASAPGRSSGNSDPALRVLLASVDEYLTAYERDLSAIVAEERYRQVARYRRNASSNERLSVVELRSDFLLVQPPGGGAWIPFRDVFEVDGAPVRDRDERLKRLFLEKTSDALSEAQRITDEGARYNVGGITRNVNVPTFPLAFLKSSNRDRFALKEHGEEVVDGLRAWRIDYVERNSPTFIQTAIDGKDVPVEGSVWVDPVNGRIVKTHIRTTKSDVAMDVTVVYRPNETLGLWIPSEMKEKYVASDVTVEGSATYSNFRRFRVLTDEQIKIPKLN